MEFTVKVPKPGQANTFSTTTVLPRMIGTAMQKTETATCMEFLKMRAVIFPSGNPQARA
ncbi:hypothetical protein D1872_325330 [compost metagenome]